MKFNVKKIVALVLTLALVVTTITFTAGNSLKAEGEEDNVQKGPEKKTEQVDNKGPVQETQDLSIASNENGNNGNGNNGNGNNGNGNNGNGNNGNGNSGNNGNDGTDEYNKNGTFIHLKTGDFSYNPVTIKGKSFTKSGSKLTSPEDVNFDQGDVVDVYGPSGKIGTITIIEHGKAETGGKGNYWAGFTAYVPPTLSLNVNGLNYNKPYDGATHGDVAVARVGDKPAPAGTEIKYSTDGGNTWSTTAPTIKDVGSVTVKVKATCENYNSAEGTYTLTVTPAQVTVKAKPASKAYGEEDPAAFGAEVSGVVDDYEIGYSVARPRVGIDEAAGTYTKAIVPSGAATQGNYSVKYEAADFTITKLGGMTVSGEGCDVTYDANEHGTAATASITEGTEVKYSTDGGKTWSDDIPKITDVGEITVTVKAENPNYETATDTYVLKVNPKAAKVTAKPASKVYKAEDPAFQAEVSGVIDSYKLSYSVTRPGAGTDEAVGTYENAIVPSGETAQGNYTVSYEAADFEITSADGLTVSGSDYNEVFDTKAHGSAATVNITEGTTISYSVNGGEWTTDVPEITNVGTMSVDVKAKNPNYKTATASYTLKVKPAPVTVTADSNSKAYGVADPAFTAQVSGVLDSYVIIYNVTRPEAGTDEAVGTYKNAIVPAGEETQGNYEVSYVKADFTISASDQLALNVSGAGYEDMYDKASHGGFATANVTEGTTISYSVDNGATWTTTAPTITNVGEQEVLVKAENPNFVTAEGSYALKVTPVPVTVTAENAVKTVGNGDPDFTATVSGLIDDYELEYSFTRAEGEDAGDYAITVSGAKVQGNYEVTYVPAVLTITDKKVLDLAVSDGEWAYDGGLHYTVATSNVAGAKITYSVNDLSWSEEPYKVLNAGTVTVTAKAEKADYETVTKTYTLKINPLPVTVKANDIEITYGEDIPALSAEVTGTLSGDSVEYQLSRKAGTDAGEYAITPAGAAKQGNYEVTYIPSKLTIKKATMSVTATGDEGTYNGNPYAGEATPSVEEGTKVSYSTDGGKTWTEEPPTRTDAGTTTVQVKVENPNYETVTTSYEIVVAPKAVTVRANDVTIKTGDALPELTAEVSGLVNKDDVIEYTVTREGSETAAGTYKNVLKAEGEATQGNYAVTYLPGTLTIADKVQVTLEVGGYEGVYDGESHSPSVNPFVGGVADKDVVIEYSTDNGKTWSTDVPSAKDAGTVTVLVRGSKEGYEPSAEMEVKISISPRPIHLFSGSADKTFDGEALTCETVWATNLVEGEYISMMAVGKQVEVGDSLNYIKYAFGDLTDASGVAAKADNYYVDGITLGTLTVNPADEPVIVDPPEDPIIPVINGGGGNGNGGGNAFVATGNANGGADMTQIANAKTPLGMGLLDAHCCILHLLIMLAALLMLMWYTHDMKKRQRRIFELEDELENGRQ